MSFMLNFEPEKIEEHWDFKILDNVRTKEEIIENLVDVLNKGSFTSLKTRKQIVYYYAEYIMSELNLKNVSFVYSGAKGYLGRFNEINEYVYLNEKYLFRNFPYEMLNIVAHELKHCFQLRNKERFKTINTAREFNYPLSHFYTLGFDMSDNDDLMEYYNNSMDEVDARVFALDSVKNFALALHMNKNANIKTLKMSAKLYKKVGKGIEKEVRKQTRAEDIVSKKQVGLEFDFYYDLMTLLDNAENSYPSLKPDIEGKVNFYLQFCCDEKLVDKIFKLCEKFKDTELALMCVNHENTKINTEHFMEMLSLFAHGGKIEDLSLLKQGLKNWKEDEIERLCKKYNSTLKYNYTYEDLVSPKAKYDVLNEIE